MDRPVQMNRAVYFCWTKYGVTKSLELRVETHTGFRVWVGQRIRRGSVSNGLGFSLGFFIWAWAWAHNMDFRATCFHFGLDRKGIWIGSWAFFLARSRRGGVSRMTRSNEETTLFGERALGCTFSMAHETVLFGKRWYWGLLWSETASSHAVPSFLSETSSSAARGIKIFLFLSSASSSSSIFDFSSKIFSSSSRSSNFGSSSSHERGYE
jgi:hypothetical protein